MSDRSFDLEERLSDDAARIIRVISLRTPEKRHRKHYDFAIPVKS